MDGIVYLFLLLCGISNIICQPFMDELNALIGKYLDNHKRYPLSHRKILSSMNFSVPAITTTAEERSGKIRCSFVGAHCPIEAVEHLLVDKYLLPTDSVLELGARYGTTSCQIAAKQHNSGKLIAVEPDLFVWNLLAQNRIAHHCNIWIYHGVISNASVLVESSDYATRAIASSVGRKGKKSVGFMQFDEIQEKTGVQFNALLIDCEGCIDTMFHNKAGDDSIEKIASYLANVEVIILEADMSLKDPDCKANCVDYDTWLTRFATMGFTKVHEKPDDTYVSIAHYVLERVEIRNKKRASFSVKV